MSTKDLLAQYNDHAAAVGAKTLKAWKGSKAQLQAKLDALPPLPAKNGKKKTTEGVSLAELARQAEKNPKVVRARFRRLYAEPKDGMPMPLDEARWVFAEEDREAVAELVG
jgi:hypothetical protein